MVKKKEVKKETKKAAKGAESLTPLFDKTVEAIHQKLGQDVVKSIADVRRLPSRPFSSGSLGLDWVINPKAGGMLRGQMLEFWGAFSTGKTTFALNYCLNCTANGKVAIWVDAEHTLQPDMVENIGIDSKLFYVIDESDGRIEANAVENLIKSSEVGVVVVDSAPAFKPALEVKKGEDPDVTRARMAEHAGFLTLTVPRILGMCRKHGVMLIMLNQQRKNLSGYGSPVKPACGTVLEHHDSVRIHLTGSVKSKDDRILDDNDEIVGQITKAECDKNKLSRPFQECRVPFYLGLGPNPYMEVAAFAVQRGLVTLKGSWVLDPDTGENIANSRDNFALAMAENVELYRKFRAKVTQSLGLNYPADLKVVNPFHDENLNPREVTIKSYDEVAVINAENEPDEETGE